MTRRKKRFWKLCAMLCGGYMVIVAAVTVSLRPWPDLLTAVWFVLTVAFLYGMHILRSAAIVGRYKKVQ